MSPPVLSPPRCGFYDDHAFFCKTARHVFFFRWFGSTQVRFLFVCSWVRSNAFARCGRCSFDLDPETHAGSHRGQTAGTKRLPPPPLSIQSLLWTCTIPPGRPPPLPPNPVLDLCRGPTCFLFFIVLTHLDPGASNPPSSTPHRLGHCSPPPAAQVSPWKEIKVRFCSSFFVLLSRPVVFPPPPGIYALLSVLLFSLSCRVRLFCIFSPLPR